MQTRSQYEEAKALANIFAGMTKSFITKDKDNNYETIHREITLEDYQDHINGLVSIGVEPRDDNNKCKFGMLDIDEHKSNKKDVRPLTKGQIKKIIDKINFLDPNHNLKERYSFSSTEYNVWNSRTWFVSVENNILVLFPSWLEHSVEPNEKATKNRISLSFNVFAKGIFGGKDAVNELIL